MIIDTNFCFADDTPDFWTNEGKDPDKYSQKLREYHQFIWSRQLPNNEKMDLQSNSNYLSWKNFRFGSDSIINMYLHHKSLKEFNLKIQNEIEKRYGDYNKFYTHYHKRGYTIGGSIIYPKNGSGQFSINSSRGCNKQIKDRFDLTIECIRKYYLKEENPLSFTLNQNKDFFDLFVDFKGYISYFFLQDIVTEDYSKVNFWTENSDFSKNPIPDNIDDWFLLYENQFQFLEKRNIRIGNYFN